MEATPSAVLMSVGQSEHSVTVIADLRLDAARADWLHYLDMSPKSADADEVARWLERLKSSRRRLN